MTNRKNHLRNHSTKGDNMKKAFIVLCLLIPLITASVYFSIWMGNGAAGWTMWFVGVFILMLVSIRKELEQ